MDNFKKFVKDHGTTIVVSSAVVVTGVTILLAKHKLGLAKAELADSEAAFNALFNAFSQTDELARNAGVPLETLNKILQKSGFAVIDMSQV